jgi:hypothetical protein
MGKEDGNVMPNCDWGRPCNCIDCRTDRFKVDCPHCGFSNALKVVGGSEYHTDRKGMGYYEFTYPNGTKDLVCYHCSKVITGVRYYDDYDKQVCESNLLLHQNKLNGLVCCSCGAVEGEYGGLSIFKRTKLIKFENRLYCQNCIDDVAKNKIPDPSNENEKYIFDGEKLKWELHKVKIECPSCHKKRWLNAENRWKTMCKKCYLG